MNTADSQWSIQTYTETIKNGRIKNLAKVYLCKFVSVKNMVVCLDGCTVDFASLHFFYTGTNTSLKKGLQEVEMVELHLSEQNHWFLEGKKAVKQPKIREETDDTLSLSFFVLVLYLNHSAQFNLKGHSAFFIKLISSDWPHLRFLLSFLLCPSESAWASRALWQVSQ